MATKEERKLKWLTCCCCGLDHKGRQWYNRDTGYGLCNNCAVELEEETSAANMKECYGIKGIHYLASN